MKIRGVLLLLVLLFGPGFALGADGDGAEPGIRVEKDGSIRQGARIVRMWPVNHRAPGDLAAEVLAFVPAGVSVTPKGPNILRIDAPEDVWPVIEKILAVVDVPEPQVFVEAKIIEIRHDSNLEFGFETSYDRRAATDAAQTFFGKFTGNFNPEGFTEAIATGKPFQGGTFEFRNSDGSIAKHGRFDYVLRALQERGSAELLSQPSILALQGETATINTGVEFPIQSVQVQGNTSNVTTKMEKTGITLSISPLLVGRDYVKLSISAEDKQITERIPGPNGSLNPVLSSRTASTKVSVRDGETIIIGGLLTSTTNESKSGLPLLSDLPLLSWLFSSTRKQTVKSELVFFITPRILKASGTRVILPPAEEERR